jgi:hypothetical protein
VLPEPVLPELPAEPGVADEPELPGVVDDPELPVEDDPVPLAEPEPGEPDDDEEPLLLESGDADGDVPSLREHAVTPIAITSAKNTERALVMSHLLPRGCCHRHARDCRRRAPRRVTKLR